MIKKYYKRVTSNKLCIKIKNKKGQGSKTIGIFFFYGYKRELSINNSQLSEEMSASREANQKRKRIVQQRQ